MTGAALIILDGVRPARRTLNEYWNKSDFRVCADGAAATCLEYKLKPDLIIGDLDSIEADVAYRLADVKMIRDSGQDTTDSEKAIQFIIENGYRTLYLLGALGKRLDHGLYNLGLLKKYHERMDDLFMVTDSEMVFLISGEKTFQAPPGTRISLLPLYGPAENVVVRGLTYPVDNMTMELGRFASISNTFRQLEASVRIGSGSLLVVMERAVGDGLSDGRGPG